MSPPKGNPSALLPIEDVFSIAGRGTVVTGRIVRGTIRVGDELEVVGFREPTKRFAVTGVEMFRKLLDAASAGDSVGLLLRGATREDVERGQVMATPGTIAAATRFVAEVTADAPVVSGSRPQLRLHSADVTSTIHGSVAQGTTGRVSIELIVPIALEAGASFALVEGGRGIASGTILSVP